MRETITSSIDYETALVMALAYAETRPEPGQPEYEAFEDLLGQIVAFRQVRPEAQPSPVDTLERKIADFERKKRNSEFLHRDGDGIGSTLGMDVSRS